MTGKLKLSAKNQIFKILKVLVFLKLGFLVLRAFAPFSHPHITRQTDTMAVSYRYWMRWFIEDPRDISLLPAVLNSGNLRGIQSMEFPLYNLIFAPVFALPIEWARPSAMLLSLVLMLSLSYWAWSLWKDKYVEGVSARLAIPLMFLFGVSSVYFYRFMPDYFAFILVMIGMGQGLKQKPNWLLAFVISTTGLLEKPTAVIAFAPLLLMLSKRDLLISILRYIAPAFLVCVCYYTVGVGYLRSLSDQPEYFYTDFRDPIFQLFEFFSHPKELFFLFLKKLFGAWIFLVFLIFLMTGKRPWKLMSVLGLQVMAIAALDGQHSFVHDYYYLSTSFICALLLVQLFNGPVALSYLALCVVAVTTLEKSFYEVRNVFRQHSWSDCRSLKARNPQLPWGKGFAFRSEYSDSPTVGLCFGEKHGVIDSNWGLTVSDKKSGCKVHDKINGATILDCSGRK